MQRVYEKTAELIRQNSGLAGCAVASISGGKVDTWCFGDADTENRRPVTEQSFFDIASNSKAFTTMLAGIAAEEGRFDWDAPIITYLPDFETSDDITTRLVSGRDMASHRTGMSSHDFIRDRVRGSRRDTVMRAKYAGFPHGFRAKYDYNNHFYIVLGYALEQIYGKSWETLVSEKIMTPLGIDVRYRGPGCDLSGLDCALPHAVTAVGGVTRCEYTNSHTSGPCGGIRTNLAGMVKWLGLMMGRGEYNGVRICREKTWKELVTPVITCPGAEECHKEKGNRYALAWHVSVYGGHELVHHSGSVPGFNSRVGFFPELGKGYIALFNANGTAGPRVFQEMLCDTLLGAPEEDYSKSIEPWRKTLDESIAENEKYLSAPLIIDKAYCGRFYHPAYDDFTVTADGAALRLTYGGFTGLLRQKPDGKAEVRENGTFPSWVHLSPAQDGMAFRCSDNPELEYNFVRLAL